MDEAARIISTVVARELLYRDTDRDEWVDAMVNSGVPPEYGEVLRTLTATIPNEHGSRPNDDVLTRTGTQPTTFTEFAAKAAAAWEMRDNTMKTPIANLEEFAALDPFFRIVEEGLAGFVEPGHFFDLLADDIVTEFVITVPGYPSRVEGRAALAELYRPTAPRCP